MKRFAIGLLLSLLTTFAHAQCSGPFPNGYICGNNTGATTTAAPVPFSSFLSGLIVGTTTITGGNNQAPLFNNAGVLGNDLISSTWSTFLQTGTGTVTRTVQAKLTDTVNAIDFGITADASTAYSATFATTNATALMNALATGKCVYFPYNVNGYSFIGDTIAVSTSQCMVGENQVLMKSQPATSGYFIRITAFEVLFGPAIVQNFHIDMTGSGTTATAIRFGTSSAVVAGAQISQLLCTNAVECIGDETHASNYIVDIKMYDIRCLATRGRQIYSKRSRGFIWMDSIRIDQTAGSGQTVSPVTWASAQFDDVIGIELNRFDSVGPVTTTYQVGQTGLVITGAGTGQASIWLNRILIDNVSGNGITITNVDYIMANWLEVFANLGTGIDISLTQHSQFTNVFARGGVGLTGAAAGANGITCTVCLNTTWSNVISTLWTGQGIVFNDSTDNTITSVQSTANTGAGILEVGTANRNLFSGGILATNTGGNYTLLGVASRLDNFTFSGTQGTTGTPTNNNTCAGCIGEVISSTVVSGSAVALTTATTANMTSISLTAGDWDVTCDIHYNFGATTSITRLASSISQTSITLDQTAGQVVYYEVPAQVPSASIPITLKAGTPSQKLLAATTTIYCTSYAEFTISTAAVWGQLRARRMR